MFNFNNFSVNKEGGNSFALEPKTSLLTVKLLVSNGNKEFLLKKGEAFLLTVYEIIIVFLKMFIMSALKFY